MHLIFWGSNWNASPGAELKTQLLKMFEGLSSSAYQGILTQYFDSTGRISSSVSVDSYVDTGVAAPTAVSDEKIEAEVAAAVKAKGWPREFNSQFVVIPAPGTTYEESFGGFCAYHSVDGSGSSYTFDAYAGDEPFKKGCIAYDKEKNPNHVTSMLASHEYAESATDPQADGEWVTIDGWEISDICISGDDELPNGTWVQGQWDNYQNECSLSDPTPPHVYVAPVKATGVTAHAATLNAKVYPEALKTEYHFEYGLTTAYGSSTPTKNLEPGATVDAATEVAQSLTGLENEVTYHYRVVAANSTGTFYGPDQTLTTSNWSIQTTPVPSEAAGATEFSDVSCLSSAECIGVGRSTVHTEGNPYAHDVPFAERWDGSKWSVQSTPKPTGADPVLEGVSCSSSSACMATGSSVVSGRRPFAEVWNGSSWSLLTMPVPSGTQGTLTLPSVSCVSSIFCVAVGGYATKLQGGIPSDEKTLIEFWNGSSWSIVSSPNAAGKNISRLSGVSCTSPSACTAVGNSRALWYQEKGGPLAERWNGSEWSVESPPSPSGAEETVLEKVSCVAPTICMAVGNSNHEGSTLAISPVGLTESWDGTAWALRSSNVTAPLYSVSCASFNSCTVVGDAISQHWNGSSWLSASTAPPPGGSQLSVRSVACPSAVVCTAVGRYYAEFEGYMPLAEQTVRQWPVDSTEAATAVTASTATLNGSINPEGLETKYQLEYGKTTAYGQSVPSEAKSVGNGTSNASVSQAISGLEPLTKYHFRVIATNAEGTTYGADMTFTTSPNLNWFGCAKQSGGVYASSKCTTVTTPGAWESTRLKEGEKVGISAHPKSIVFTSIQTGVEATLSCETEAVSSSLENPGGAGNGTGQTEIKYSGCKALGTSGSGCKVTNTGTFPLKLTLVSIEGKAQVVLAPVEGTTLANFNFEGCSSEAFNGKWPLTGTTHSSYSNTSSQLEFGASTSAGLKLRGQATTATGTMGLETTAGGYLRAEPVLHWFGCNKQAGGKYADGKCAAEGSPNEWESTRLKEGEKVGISAHPKSIVFTSIQTGVEATLSCETEAVSSSLENPGGAGNGTGQTEIKYSGCKALGTSGSGCKVTNTGTFPLKLTLVSIEGKAQVMLAPVEGTTLANFNFEGCSSEAFNGKWPLTGTTHSSYSNTSSQLEFGASTSAGLKLRGQATTATGTMGLETTAGGYLRAE